MYFVIFWNFEIGYACSSNNVYWLDEYKLKSRHVSGIINKLNVVFCSGFISFYAKYIVDIKIYLVLLFYFFSGIS